MLDLTIPLDSVSMYSMSMNSIPDLLGYIYIVVEKDVGLPNLLTIDHTVYHF